MEAKQRDLTDVERFVLEEVQAYWGEQNTAGDVFFSDRDEAVLFVVAPDGSHPVCVVLTNLGAWHRDGILSLEERREQIKGPDAARTSRRDA